MRQSRRVPKPANRGASRRNQESATRIALTTIAGFTPIRALRLTAVRDAANAARVTAGLAPQSWSEPIVSATTLIRASHIIEIRTALTSALAALGLTTPSFAMGVVTGGVVHAVDVQELREAMR